MLFVVILAGIAERGLGREHAVEDARQLVGGGGDRLGCTAAGSQAPVEGAERAFRIRQRVGSTAEGGGGPVGGDLGPAAPALSLGHLPPRPQGPTGGPGVPLP